MSNESESLLRFLAATKKLMAPDIHWSEEALAWYWDHNYRPSDLAPRFEQIRAKRKVLAARARQKEAAAV